MYLQYFVLSDLLWVVNKGSAYTPQRRQQQLKVWGDTYRTPTKALPSPPRPTVGSSQHGRLWAAKSRPSPGRLPLAKGLCLSPLRVLICIVKGFQRPPGLHFISF